MDANSKIYILYQHLFLTLILMNTMHYKYLLLLLLFTEYVSAQEYNRPTPPDFPSYQFELNELSFRGHYCANSYQLNAATKTNMFILDSLGYIAWYRKDQQETSFDYKYHEGINNFSSITYKPEVAAVFLTYDSDLQLLDTLTTAISDERGDTHDFLLLENGNKIIGTLYDTIMNLSQYTFNGITGSVNTSVRGYGIQEFDEEHHLIWQWHSTDFVHPEEFSEGLSYYSSDFDYAHGNSFSLDDDGDLLVSLRNTSTVYKVDRLNRTGEILWRLGGERSTFNILNPGDTFSAQHSANRLSNGNIGIYDNGNLRVPTQYSRAAAYALDFSDSTATLEWSYDANQSIYASAMGNAQWLGDSLVLINWGYVFRPSPTFSLVNQAGDLLTSLYFEDSYMSYRIQATTLGFDLPRPLLTYDISGDSIVISAPAGYAEYVWSTGETTPSITATTDSVYQVWVPHGIGMVGSHPLKTSTIVENSEAQIASFKVFPNPATNHLNIAIDFNDNHVFSVELYNSSGQMIKGFKKQNDHFNTVIKTVDYPRGIYYLKVITASGALTEKIILL